MFQIEAFVGACKASLGARDPAAAVAALLRAAVAEPGAVDAALNGGGAKSDSGAKIDMIYRAADLTVINMLGAPAMFSPIHNHNMWGVIGLYAGQEDNHIYLREDGGIVETELASLVPGDVWVMDPDLIHAVANPLGELNGALHVYGGDLVERPGRSLWEPGAMTEEDYSFDKVVEYTTRLSK